jgi:hypothetical protein
MSAFTTLGRALRKQNEETETKRSTSLALITLQHVVLWASLLALVVGIALLVKTGHSVDPTGILVVVSVSRRIPLEISLTQLGFYFDHICLVAQPRLLPPPSRRVDRTPERTKIQAAQVSRREVDWPDMSPVASIFWLGFNDGRETAGLSRVRQRRVMGCWLTLRAGTNRDGALCISSVRVPPSCGSN